MRAFVITLLVAAAPIYLGGMLLGGGSGFGIGGFSAGDAVRYRVEASELAHDAIAKARDYAMAHPGLVEGLKAHRAELEEFRSRLCSAVTC
ncbi:MAG TPA: hypothetical protein VNF99_04295 [Stellaceae bacterium]|nr:hypothetical protein [Stellaceae bacterium]